LDPLERLVDDLPHCLFLVQARDDDGDLGRSLGHRVTAPDRSTRLRRGRPREEYPGAVAASRGRVVRTGRALTRWAESPVSEVGVFVIALGVYGVVSFALPLQAGRDLPRYLLSYAQLFDSHVTF